MVEIKAPVEDQPASRLQPPGQAADRVQPPRPGVPGEQRITVGDQEVVDSEAITQSSVVPPPVDGSWTTGEDAAVPGDRFFREPPEQTAGAGVTSSRTAAASSDSADNSMAPANWALQSTAAQQRRQWMLVSLILLFGLLVSSVLFYQFVSRWQQTAKQDSDSTPVVAAADDATEASPDEAAEEMSVAGEGTPADAPEQPPATDLAAMPSDSQTSPPATPSPDVFGGDDSSTDALAAVTPDAMDTSPTAVPKPDTPVVARSEVPAPIAPPTDIPDSLKKFAPLMSFETTGNQDARTLEAPPSIDTVRLDEAAKQLEKGETKPGRKPLDIKRAMSLRFALDNRGASLWELALVLSQFTTVPIELELISLDAAGIRVDQPMPSPKGAMTAQEWLNRFCQEQGLVTFVLPDRILLSASETRIIAGLAPAFQIEDLPGDKAAIVQLLKSVTQEPEPEQADDAGDDADPAAADAEAAKPKTTLALADNGVTIVPEATPRSRMRTALALEVLRQVFGVAPKLAPEFTARWAGTWPKDNIASEETKLGEWPLVTGGKSLGSLDSPRAAAGILRELATINQSQALVLWGDAVFQDLYPADPLMPYTPDDDAGSLLNEMLGEQNLEARRCGPHLWLVTSEATYDRLEVITWLPVPAGSETQIQERLAASLGIADVQSIPVGFMHQCMIVRCPRYIARQLSRVVQP